MKKTLLMSFLIIFLIGTYNQDAQADTQKFCISGTSDGIGFSWGIVVGGGCQCSETGLVVPPGGSASEFVTEFVNSINATGGIWGISAAVDPEDPNCFTITREGGEFEFWVGDAAGTPCSGTKVTDSPAPVPFNPEIMYIPTTSVPTLTEWGVITFMTIMIVIGAFFVLKRKKIA